MKNSKVFQKLCIVVFLIFAIAVTSFAQNRFPGKTWSVVDKPEDMGYSTKKLEEAKKYSETFQTAAVMVIVDGIVLYQWVKESTSYCSDATIYRRDGYGYMWWAAKDNNRYPHFRNAKLSSGTFSARGAGGQYIIVIPDYDMVFVHRVNTFEGHNVRESDVGTLLQMILDAKN